MSWGSFSRKRDCWVKGYDDFSVPPPKKSSVIHTATNEELAFLFLLRSYVHGVLPLWFYLMRPVNNYFPVHLLTSRSTVGALGTDVCCKTTQTTSLFWSLPTHKIGDVITDIFKGRRTYLLSKYSIRWLCAAPFALLSPSLTHLFTGPLLCARPGFVQHTTITALKDPTFQCGETNHE